MSRILVVDDDAPLAWIARAALSRFGGHTVETARSADEARTMLSAQSFDVVLLDAMMPDQDGGQLLATLGAHAPPVVMLTARTSEVDRARYASLGARGLIAKPFDPRTLAEQLARILETPA